MRSLVLFALLSLAAAKPKPDGLYGGWDAGLSLGHDAWAQPALTLDHGPLIQEAPVVHAPIVQAAPIVHAAPVVHAPVAVAKAATSYSSFQRVIHPVSHPVVHAAPVVHAPLVSAPVVHSAPILSQPLVHSIGHGW